MEISQYCNVFYIRYYHCSIKLYFKLNNNITYVFYNDIYIYIYIYMCVYMVYS